MTDKSLTQFEQPKTLDVWFDKGVKRRFEGVVEAQNIGNQCMVLYLGAELRMVQLNWAKVNFVEEVFV